MGGLYGSVSAPAPDDPRIKYPRLQRLVYESTMVLLMMSALCSTFTMIMFLLFKVYTVTALGMYKDVAYTLFLQATGRHRMHAFNSLILSMTSFVVAFALNLYTRIKGNRGIVASLAVLTLCGYILHDVYKLLHFADKYIFSS